MQRDMDSIGRDTFNQWRSVCHNDALVYKCSLDVKKPLRENMCWQHPTVLQIWDFRHETERCRKIANACEDRDNTVTVRVTATQRAEFIKIVRRELYRVRILLFLPKFYLHNTKQDLEQHLERRRRRLQSRNNDWVTIATIVTWAGCSNGPLRCTSAMLVLCKRWCLFISNPSSLPSGMLRKLSGQKGAMYRISLCNGSNSFRKSTMISLFITDAV